MNQEEKRAYNAAYRAAHREEIRAHDRKRNAIRRARPGFSEYQANLTLKCRYGISLDEKREMYDAQKGLCKVCGERLPKDFRKAHTDHDHETEQIRGLVHWSCNKLIGFVENNMDLIETIYVYLGLRRKN